MGDELDRMSDQEMQRILAEIAEEAAATVGVNPSSGRAKGGVELTVRLNPGEYERLEGSRCCSVASGLDGRAELDLAPARRDGCRRCADIPQSE